MSLGPGPMPLNTAPVPSHTWSPPSSLGALARATAFLISEFAALGPQVLEASSRREG